MALSSARLRWTLRRVALDWVTMYSVYGHLAVVAATPTTDPMRTVQIHARSCYIQRPASQAKGSRRRAKTSSAGPNLSRGRWHKLWPRRSDKFLPRHPADSRSRGICPSNNDRPTELFVGSARVLVLVLIWTQDLLCCITIRVPHGISMSST